ncbi:unnamed protein product [Caenorhabditis nigoni]
MNPTCFPNIKLFDSPEFLNYSLNCITVISTPIHIIGLYCIIRKTPIEMKSAKWYLLNYHIWMVLFDYSVSFLTIPVLLFPAFAGYPLGILRAFGFPTSLPCLPKYMYDADVIVIADEETYIYPLSMCILLVFLSIGEIGLCILFLMYNTAKQLLARTMSERTLGLQKKFFIGIVIQISVPLVMFCIPFLYALISVLSDYYNQSLTNFAIIIASLQSSVATIDPGPRKPGCPDLRNPGSPDLRIVRNLEARNSGIPDALPCLPTYIHELPLFVFTENATYHLSTFSLFFILICSQITYFVISLVLLILPVFSFTQIGLVRGIF